MKKISVWKPAKLFALPAMVLGLIIFVSCGKEDEMKEEKPNKTIIELINSDEYKQAKGADATKALDSLVKYLNLYPNLGTLLQGTTAHTLFAPSNTAFISLLSVPGFPKDIKAVSPNLVGAVLSYHIVAGTTLSATLTSGASVTSLYNGEKIVVNADGTLKTGASNQAIVIEIRDKKATNGVVHVLKSVMIPPTIGALLVPILGTNAGTLLLGAPFTILADGIRLADAYATANSKPTLTSILAGTTKNTVFAPTNATFDAAKITANSYTGEQWYGIIATHVVLGTVIKEGDLSAGASFANAAKGTIQVVLNDKTKATYGIGIFLDSDGVVDPADKTTIDAEVARIDAAANSNGTIHVIAGVLRPKK